MFSAILRTPCENLGKPEVAFLRNTLRDCFGSFEDESLETCSKIKSSSNNCSAIPPQCFNYPILDIFRYYIPKLDNAEEVSTINWTIVFISNSCFSTYGELAQWITESSESITSDSVSVMAIKVPNGVQEELALQETQNVTTNDLAHAIALGFILIFLGIYMNSIVLLITFLASMVFTVFLGLFLYLIVFRLTLFPTVNYFSILLLFITSVSDTFIMADTWTRSTHETLLVSTQEATRELLYHCSTSVSITCVLLLAGYLCALVSPIVQVKLFAVFGISIVLSHWFYSMTLFPVVYVIRDKIQLCRNCDRNKLTLTLRKINTYIWNSAIPGALSKIYVISIIIFILLGICGVVVALIIPKWNMFAQMLSSRHNSTLIEAYGEFEDKLYFSKLPNLQIIFGWNINEQNGFMSGSSSTVSNNYIDIYNADTQKSLDSMCKDINSDLVKSSQFCFFSESKALIQSCLNNKYKCCGLTLSDSDPVPAQCLHDKNLLEDLYASNVFGKLIFDSSSAVGFQFAFESHNLDESVYSEVSDIIGDLNKFISSQSIGGIYGCLADYGESEVLREHDLKHSLLFSTWLTVVLCFVTLTIILIVLTANLFLAFYVLSTIILCTSSIVGCFILLELHLAFPVIHLIASTVTISAHFASNVIIAYMLSFPEKRNARVMETISAVGSPLTISALVDSLACVAQLHINIPGLEIFSQAALVIIILSWLYIMFFLCPFLHAIGPQGRQGDILWWLWKARIPKWVPHPASSANFHKNDDLLHKDIELEERETSPEQENPRTSPDGADAEKHSLSDILEESFFEQRPEESSPEPTPGPDTNYPTVHEEDNIYSTVQEGNISHDSLARHIVTSQQNLHRRSSKKDRQRVRIKSPQAQKRESLNVFSIADSKISSITNLAAVRSSENIFEEIEPSVNPSISPSANLSVSPSVNPSSNPTVSNGSSATLKQDFKWNWGTHEEGRRPTAFTPSYLSRGQMRSSNGLLAK